MVFRPPFRRTRHGTVEARFEPAEAGLLARICRELTELLAGDEPVSPAEGEPDPVLARLFPRAYLDPTEEEAEAEWQRLVHSDLLEGRRIALETMGRTLAHADTSRAGYTLVLSGDEAEAWLSVLNDARLALGTRLEVTEDLDPADFRADDPEAAPYAVYWWLGLLQEHLIDALSI